VAALKVPVKGLRLGLLIDEVQLADQDVQKALAAAVQVFAGLGCTVAEITLKTASYSLGAAYSILGPEAFAHHEPLLRKHAAAYPVDVRRRLLAGGLLSAADYLKGQRARTLIRHEMNGQLQKLDALLTATLPMPAPALDATEVRLGTRTENARMALTQFTRLFNVSGHPALAVPCGFTAAGLPLSLQLVGRAFDEATILRLGHAYERATAWHQRRPPFV